MTKETIFQTIKESALDARKSQSKELASLLNTFLADLQNHITGGLSAAVYGLYAPTDEQIIPFLVKTIQGLNKGISTASTSNNPSAQTYVDKTRLEVETLSLFLPKALEPEELRMVIIKLIDEDILLIGDKKLFGSIMSKIKEQYEGRYNPAKVREMFNSITTV